MADIRINALATTATASASDDYLAIDGAANGTRKLSAYSPTFGGNLTVSGNTNTFGSGTADTDVIVNAGAIGSYSAAIKYQSAGTNYWKVGRGAATGGANFEWYDYQGTPGTRFTIASSTGNATLAGNLTVSGTGLSSIGTTTGFSYSTVPTAGFSVGAIGTGGSFMVQTPSLSAGYGSGFAVDGTYTSGKSVINLKAFGVSSGGPYSADLAFFTSATTTLAEQMRLNSAGNLLLGTTTDSSNGKLQLATHTTSAGGIGFGTDTSLYRTAAGRLAITSSSDPYLYFYAGASEQGKIAGSAGNLFIDGPSGGGLYLRTSGGNNALTLDSSQRTILSGALRLANSYVATPQISTGYVTIQDSTGTTYKVLVAP